VVVLVPQEVVVLVEADGVESTGVTEVSPAGGGEAGADIGHVLASEEEAMESA